MNVQQRQDAADPTPAPTLALCCCHPHPAFQFVITQPESYFTVPGKADD